MRAANAKLNVYKNDKMLHLLKFLIKVLMD